MKTWFITGTSTGIGRRLAEAALARGPGAFATELGKNAHVTHMSAPYAPPQRMLDVIMKDAKFSHPAGAAQAILKAVDAPEPPLRLAVGADALEFIHQKMAAETAEFDRWAEVSHAASSN